MPPVDWALVVPPLVKPSEPTPGVLVLAAHLRARGRTAAVADANLWVLEDLLSPENLAAAADQISATGGVPARTVTSARRSVRGAAAAAAALRRPDTYRDPGRYRAAVERINEGLRAVSRARGARIGLADLELTGLSPLSSADLLWAAREPGRVPIAPELTRAARRILAGEPRRVAVSASFLNQALAAFALAGLLRAHGFRGDLVLGGALPSVWGELLGPDSPVFAVWDAVVLGPGEDALARWTDGPPVLPGVRAPRRGVWRAPARTPEAPTVQFEPDPAGLAWDRYLAPGPVLPVAATRGCYWRRCAFCPEAARGTAGFSRGAPAELARGIVAAADRAGARWVHLTDEAVPVSHLRVLARGLRGTGISWYGFARPEPALADPALAAELARGGCRMLQLGVESASQRLLDSVSKGIRADRSGEVVRALAGAGIRTYVYLLVGLPTETRDEAEATLDWARRHAGSITFLNLSLFHLPRGSRLEADAEALGLRWRDEDPGPDLSLYRAFHDPRGWSRPGLRRRLAEVRGDPVLGPILGRVPPGFTVNHAGFCPLPGKPR